MRISNSKSESKVLSQKGADCFLRVGGEILPQVEELKYKYLGDLFRSEGRKDCETDRQTGEASAVSQTLLVCCEQGAELEGIGHKLWVLV